MKLPIQCIFTNLFLFVNVSGNDGRYLIEICHDFNK
jgi:hypothetical protein